MNEWGFAAEISKWWEKTAIANPEWKINKVRVEEVAPGSKTRSDLIVLGESPALCGEIRLPDHSNPSPLDFDNLENAVRKALKHGCRWAFTSDTRSLFLIDTTQPGSLITKIVHKESLGEGVDREQLDDPSVLSKVSNAWVRVFSDLAPIIVGQKKPIGMAPDALFVEALRELLSAPVAAIRDSMNERRKSDPKFQSSLIEWMVDEQGWVHDPSRWDAEVSRAAKITAYVFVTRILFYEALRRSKTELMPLAIPEITTPELAAGFLRLQFEEARRISGDYETLFSWDQVSIYSILSTSAVHHWRRMILHIEHFDLSTIDHDVLGRLFERLIEPNERYEWGQHYTSSDVVDLMLAFALRDGVGNVLDPAAGGGTFLVRAYARKKVLNPSQTHQDRLRELFGVDVSRFASTIATVNLAIKQLEFTNNYPQIATKSFFRLTPNGEFMNIPLDEVASKTKTQTTITLPQMRAVVGNPPYVKYSKLGTERQKEVMKLLGRGDRAKVPSRISKASNYHLYFWFHAAQFLERNGYIALLTSGEWLDSDYGAALQGWLLNNFCIEAFIESGAEPWFSEARVGTVVTVARLCSSRQERDANQVRFVTLRRTIRELVGHADDPAAHFASVDLLRDRVLSLSGDGESNDFDWSVVTQAELRRLGMGDRDDS